MTDDIVARLRDWWIDDNSDACGRGQVDTCLRCEAADEIERLRAVIENSLGFAHVAGLFNGGRSEGNLVAGFMEWVDAHNDTVKQNESLRRCLQHAIDHVGKWHLLTAKEKQALLAEYKEALDD